MVDLDFRFLGDVEDRCYTSDMVETIVTKYFDILGEYVQLDDYNNKRDIFDTPYVMEKPGCQ